MFIEKTAATQGQTQGQTVGRGHKNGQGRIKRVQAMVLGGLMLAAGVLAGPAPQAQAGSYGGEASTHETVLAGDVDSYTRTFRGGEYAAIAVRGDGDTDLDLYVYDEDGDLVASDDDSSDQCLAVFYVSHSTTYTIHVRNRGDVYNDYVLATN